MAPYRRSSPHDPSSAPAPAREEVIVYGVLAGVGLIPVAGALAEHAPFHGEATVGLVMLIAGAVGLASAVREAWAARGVRRSRTTRTERGRD